MEVLIVCGVGALVWGVLSARGPAPTFDDLLELWPVEALRPSCPMVASGAVRLDDYHWLRANIDKVVDVLERGVMPPDAPWPEWKIDVVRHWRDAGCPRG